MAWNDGRGFPVLRLEAVSAREFVEFWASRYVDRREHLYEDSIGKPLTPERIMDLFIWKNGGRLSARKQRSVEENYIQRLDELHRFGDDLSPEEFLDRFSTGGAIWRIFWLHCWQPSKYPIYDQHVHRSMAFIEDGSSEELSACDSRQQDKIRMYLSRYLPFYARFDGLKVRSVDRALWSFGKFLRLTAT